LIVDWLTLVTGELLLRLAMVGLFIETVLLGL
jgi:hypothetical protein